uniref:Short chain dehydrogenase/reductase family protein n=1 Tax=uncultured bacterium fosmid I5J7 TaxID=1701911 RepID=A0A1B0THB1_9BACT|nr:short chain dehydrogenase/reductase family protein [uncultured bacterium fosmid I5J7]
MKILVIGATGMIGSRIAEEALSRGHEVIAASRNPDQPQKHKAAESIALDVNDTDQLTKYASLADVTVCAVSPRTSGDAETEAVAYADALIAGLSRSRVILVGGAGTLNLPDGTPVASIVPEQHAAEARGMRAAYEKISASGLDFTTLAPAGLIEPGEKTGTFRTGERTLLADADGNSRISAEDYSIALLDEVEHPQHAGGIFTVAY